LRALLSAKNAKSKSENWTDTRRERSCAPRVPRDMQRATYNIQLSACNMDHASCDVQHVTSKNASCDVQLSACKMRCTTAQPSGAAKVSRTHALHFAVGERRARSDLNVNGISKQTNKRSIDTTSPTHVHTPTRTSTHTDTRTHTHTRTSTHTHAHTRTHAHTNTHSQTQTQTQAHAQTHALHQTKARTHIHTCVRARTHTHRRQGTAHTKAHMHARMAPGLCVCCCRGGGGRGGE
jgi:hypothetical protein